MKLTVHFDREKCNFVAHRLNPSVMKQKNLCKIELLTMLIGGMMLLLIACEKRHEIALDCVYGHYATVIPDGRKAGVTYYINTSCGHSASGCRGCVSTSTGHWIHVDCQGYGNLCSKAAHLYVASASGSLYTGTTQDSTDLTDDPFFNMPDRSLFVGKDDSGTDIWLNIPAQLVCRDSVTRCFTFTGLYYSSRQVYKNQ